MHGIGGYVTLVRVSFPDDKAEVWLTAYHGKSVMIAERIRLREIQRGRTAITVHTATGALA